MAIYSGFFHWTWQFSMGMLDYQQVYRMMIGKKMVEPRPTAQFAEKYFCAMMSTGIEPKASGISDCGWMKAPNGGFLKYGISPKSSHISVGFSIVNHPFLVPPFMETPKSSIHFEEPGVGGPKYRALKPQTWRVWPCLTLDQLFSDYLRHLCIRCPPWQHLRSTLSEMDKVVGSPSGRSGWTRHFLTGG